MPGVKSHININCIQIKAKIHKRRHYMSVQCGSMLKHCSSSHHCGTLLAQMEIGAVLLYVLRSKGRGEKYQPRFAFGESIK